MTRIAHVALWTRDLERLRDFYVRWFRAVPGAAYESRNRRGFRSYFLTLPGGGARLELMSVPALGDGDGAERVGLAHLAIALESRDAVDAAVDRMRAAGVVVTSAPRTTGDGYYEAVVADPDGNLIELTT